jgi:hypothetical protein
MAFSVMEGLSSIPRDLNKQLVAAFNSNTPFSPQDFADGVYPPTGPSNQRNNDNKTLTDNLNKLADVIKEENRAAGFDHHDIAQFVADNADESTASGANTPPTGGGASSPAGGGGGGGGGSDVPAIDIKTITGRVSLDKPATLQLVAIPDRAFRFVVDYSHADPLTADSKQGQLTISETGILTGINHEHLDQLPAIVDNVAVSAIDIAKAVATWGASGIFSSASSKSKSTTSKPASTNLAEMIKIETDLNHKKRRFFKTLKRTVKMTNAFDIPVQKLIDLDYKNSYCQIDLPQDFTDQVNDFLTAKGLQSVDVVPQVLLTLRPCSSSHIRFLNECSKNILGEKYLEGVVIRRPQTVRFTVSLPIENSGSTTQTFTKPELAVTPEMLLHDYKESLPKVTPSGDDQTELKSSSKKHKANRKEATENAPTHPDPSVNDAYDVDCPNPKSEEPTGRILSDNYYQLAQTGSLAAISLRTRTARDSARSITLSAAGGITSVNETTTSPLKTWTDVLKDIAGAL